MNTSSLRIVVAWLLGQSDTGADLNGGITLPLSLKPQLSELFQAAVLEIKNRPSMDAPFERSGVWHLAVLRVMRALSAECREMTAHYEYPHGLGLGDGAFDSFMAAIRGFHIELPSAEALHAADEQRAAQEQAERDAVIAAGAQFSEPRDWSDDPDAYEYR